MADCLFCGIVAGDIPAEVVAETDRTIAFRDIQPQAPVHVLVVPRRHVENARRGHRGGRRRSRSRW